MLLLALLLPLLLLLLLLHNNTTGSSHYYFCFQLCCCCVVCVSTAIVVGILFCTLVEARCCSSNSSNNSNSQANRNEKKCFHIYLPRSVRLSPDRLPAQALAQLAVRSISSLTRPHPRARPRITLLKYATLSFWFKCFVVAATAVCRIVTCMPQPPHLSPSPPLALAQMHCSQRGVCVLCFKAKALCKLLTKTQLWKMAKT